MIRVRSIAPEEAGWYAALGSDDVRRPLKGAWADGSSRPAWSLVAEVDDGPVARGALVVRPMGGGVDTLEGTAAFLWADLAHRDHAAGFRQLIEALATRLAPHGPTTLERRLNPEVHRDIGPMRALLEGAGFHLFQEKVGFSWTPSASPRHAPGKLRMATLADIGRHEFRGVMAATTSGTLDRNDRYYIDRCGPEPWAEEIMGAIDDGDEQSWLIGYHDHQPAGFVAVSAFDEEGTWTIVHIGVVPDHRGHGHVHDLLAAADRAARDRHFTAGLSDVDVENAPMLAAMARAGHRTDERPWHVWHYRRAVERGPAPG